MADILDVRPVRAVAATGCCVVLVSLLANEWVLAWLFAKDGTLSESTLPVARSFQAGGALAGIAIVAFRRRLGAITRLAVDRHPDRFALAIGLAAGAGLIVAIELGFMAYGVLQFRALEQVFDHSPFTPGSSTAERLEMHGTVIYDVTYTLDDHGIRVTPQQDGPATRGDLIFFGGSFAFGQGVEDIETLPAVVARHAEGWRVTNYGFPGQGPAHMLRRLQFGTAIADIEGPQARVVYVFIPNHVNRAIGSMRVVTEWGRHFPYYAVTADGMLVYQGTFDNTRPMRKYAFRLLAREQVMRYYGVDLPVTPRDRDFDVTARIIAASREELAGRVPNCEFVVVLYPDQPNQAFSAARLVPYLEAYGVRYLDYTGLLGAAEEYWLRYDNHPTAKAYAELGARLATDLGFAKGSSTASVVTGNGDSASK